MARVVTESKIDGEFTGWTGDGTYKLMNGQEWEQARYKYRYRYAYCPEARVVQEGGRYWLEVEGMDDRILVRRR